MKYMNSSRGASGRPVLAKYQCRFGFTTPAEALKIVFYIPTASPSNTPGTNKQTNKPPLLRTIYAIPLISFLPLLFRGGQMSIASTRERNYPPESPDERIAAWLKDVDKGDTLQLDTFSNTKERARSEVVSRWSEVDITSIPELAEGEKRRELLGRCVPKFEFFGVSGQGGLNPDDEDDDEWKIPPGFETLVREFRASMALRGSICTCVEERIRRRRKIEWWEESTFSDLDLGNNHQRHFDEANFVIQSATRSEVLQLSMSEGADWAGHATEVLRFVAGVIDSFHPITISSVTTVDIHHEFFPTLRRGPRFRSASPTKRQRGNATVRKSRPIKEVLAARADISVNLRRKGKQARDILSTIQERFGEFPTPFKTISATPLLAVEVKSYGGSALEAEFQAVVCANAILESWRQLGAPKIYSPPAQNPNLQLKYPTVSDTDLVGVDHIIALQVVSFSWFYSIVFACRTNDSDRSRGDSDQESRKVLGPFFIGDSRQFAGTYSILRFLGTLFTYKVSVWLPGMIQRGSN
ncbi:hypothetical protein TWF481_010250 [Arthrobotrys musiformis]|uniref:PD-(D/E)XK nuclease-like domain-containing protein n=1 Tax=Arthrobotrys musiformis TaxID=47236 RepID=A0AAV9W082_9PEZI